MKKLLGLVILAVSVLFLAACGSQENLNGEYREFYQIEGYNTKISKVYPVTIKGDMLTWQGQQYSINKKDKVLMGKDTLSYQYEDDVITLEGDTYVRVDSKKYKELLKNGAEELN